MKDNDVVIISDHINETNIDRTEVITAILDKIGVQKVKITVWVDWFEQSIDLMISKWSGIKSYGVNSNLYFHLIEQNLIVEAYSVHDIKITALVRKITNIDDHESDLAINVPSIAWRRRDFKQVQITGHHVVRMKFK